MPGTVGPLIASVVVLLVPLAVLGSPAPWNRLTQPPGYVHGLGTIAGRQDFEEGLSRKFGWVRTTPEQPSSMHVAPITRVNEDWCMAG